MLLFKHHANKTNLTVGHNKMHHWDSSSFCQRSLCFYKIPLDWDLVKQSIFNFEKSEIDYKSTCMIFNLDLVHRGIQKKYESHNWLHYHQSNDIYCTHHILDYEKFTKCRYI